MKKYYHRTKLKNLKKILSDGFLCSPDFGGVFLSEYRNEYLDFGPVVFEIGGLQFPLEEDGINDGLYYPYKIHFDNIISVKIDIDTLQRIK